MPRSQRQSSVELDEDIWDYPPNGLVGKKIKLNCFDTIKLIKDPDTVIRHLDRLKRAPFAYLATETLCRYFHHEIKVLENKINDDQESIRKRRAMIIHLGKGVRLRTTRRQAEKEIELYQDAIAGRRVRKAKYMAYNRKLRSRTPLEKYMIVLEDDREVVVLDRDDER